MSALTGGGGSDHKIPDLSNFNTVKIDKNTGEIKGKNTFKGKVYSHFKGKAYVSDKKAVVRKVNEVFSALKDDAVGKDYGDKKLFDAVKESGESLAEFEALYKSVHGDTQQAADDLATMRQEVEGGVIGKFNEKIESDAKPLGAAKVESREAAVSQHKAKGGRLANDFKRNLKVGSEQDFTSPLTPKEEAFVNKYLQKSPAQLKQMAHFEMLQKRSDRIATNPPGEKIEVEFGGQKFEAHDIQDEHYQFIGCAGDLGSAPDDYKGYCEGKWPYLCTSLVDQDHPFFKEWGAVVFQVFSVPPEAIAHTSNRDLVTPWSSATEQPGWYGMSQRAQVLANHIDTAYGELKSIQGEKGTDKTDLTPMNTKFDQAIRLKRLTAEFKDFLVTVKEGAKPEHQGFIDEAIAMLVDPEKRADKNDIDEVVKNLRDNQVLEDKDINELEALLNKASELEGEYPLFKDPHFSAQDYTLNRVNLQMAALKEHYGSEALTDSERKEEYQRLFQCDDPTGKYDIMGELKQVEALLGNIPQTMGQFPTRLNRFMGPGEIVSQTSFDEHNEINLDTQRGGGIAVKAWIIPRKLVESKNPQKQQQMATLFKLAQEQGIPILIRSNPAPQE